MKKYLMSFITTILSIIITLLLITTIYYFNLINQSTYNILKIIFLLLSLLINSFILGKTSTKKGYLEGIKLSSPLIILFIFISLITNQFKPISFIYYLIILLTTIFGSMIGISTKKNCH